VDQSVDCLYDDRHTTHLGADGQKITAALDLSLVIVPVLLSAYWLWNRYP
jgi:hypothetical protein